MSRIIEFVESIVVFLKDQKFSQSSVVSLVPDKIHRSGEAVILCISASYSPTKITNSNIIYIDVMPATYHGETVVSRRLHTRHEDNAIRISIRSKRDDASETDMNTLMDVVEHTSDLLLNSSWDENTQCASVDITYDEFNKGLFSSNIVAHIKSRYES